MSGGGSGPTDAPSLRGSHGAISWPGSWRILRDRPAAAAWNMAVDEGLARELEPDTGILRIYRWARPSLSLGRNQRALGRYDPEAFGPFGVDVVRRPSGGREVLHDRELTYALVVPLDGPGSFRAAYRVVNEALVAALRSLGAEVRRAAPGGRTPSPDHGACFDEPAADEIEADGRKIVGSAQVRVGKALLQHGSLLLGPPSVSLAALRTAPSTSREEWRGAHLAGLLGRPVSYPRVAAAVEAALAGAVGGSWSRDELTGDERRAAQALERRYRSADWSWRR